MSEKHLRVWKCNYSYNSPDKFKEFLKENHLGVGEEIKMKEANSDADLEENSGVNFPG